MKRQRRLPRFAEKELAKLLGTLGFEDYASSFWNLASQASRPASECAFKDVFERQVVEQANCDPSVVAAGVTRLPLLRRTARNLRNTRNVTSSRLLEGLTDWPCVAIVAATFDGSTQDRTGALVEALCKLGAASFLLVATDRDDQPTYEFPAGCTHEHVYWPDRCSREDTASARHLALFLHVLGAHTIIVSGSRLGLGMIARYGAALKNVHHLFATLDVPAAGYFVDIHHLRAVAPHATILAASAEQADFLRARGAGVDGPGIATWIDMPEQVFGTAFDDPRSVASRTVCAALLGRGRPEQGTSTRPAPAATAAFDLSATILFHRERELAFPALSSLRAMVEHARMNGISVEACAFVDRGDEATRKIVREHGDFLDEVHEVDLGSPALVRNAATARARGTYLAFLDGDDLWGTDWLTRGVEAARSSPDVIWHPEALFAFWASDCDRNSETGMHSGYLIQQSSGAPAFDQRDLLFENMWSVNAIASTDIYRRFPYRGDDWARQIGIEDWRFNLDTLGHGIAHSIVPDTVHMIRIKEAGSFGQLHDAKALLPFLD